jgi:penicillin-binding protein 1A
MTETGFITASSRKYALAHPARIVVQPGNGAVNYVADWVMDIVDDLLGHIDDDLVVRTTIDPALQAIAEDALDQELSTKGGKSNVAQGALVAMTPEGAVRALVGGRSYAESQFNRAVVARRQPGSAFKPFVFLTALERGLTPDSVRDDAPINVRGWKPENYEHGYMGPVTLTKALALSLNTVSVRLTLEVTPQAVIRTAHRLGIASKLEPNASISLGTSEVSPLELTGAYAPFANGGMAVTPHVVRSIRKANGKLLYTRPEQPLGRVVDAQHVGMMNAMLAQTLSIGTARKAALPGWPAAGKTGTSQDFRDAWFVGYTARLVTGVWLGNDDGSPTKHVTGGSLPAEIWSRFMRAAHQGLPAASLPIAPSGTVFSGLFGQSRTTDAAAPVPPAPVGGARSERGLDAWLIDGLFGRR